ncbi:MAG: hypothetical protein NT059_10165 [Planctomycetota bacterium]|nr:hypothetical protein [Planctomycetota bacterium]
MNPQNLLKLRNGALLAVASAGITMSGCIREVISGEDPRAKAPPLTGKSSTDMLTIRIPWMEIPPPRLLLDNKLQRTEAIYARSPHGAMRFTLRTVSGVTATVDVKSKRLADDSMEFTYEITSLPPKYVVDTLVMLAADNVRPAVEVKVNGAPVKTLVGTEVVVIQLSRDAPTKILVVPVFPPEVPAAVPVVAPVPAPRT